MNTTKITAIALLTTLGLGLAAAAVSAQTTAKPATPMVKSATAPAGAAEDESEYLQKLRRLRRQLNEVKAGVDTDKNQTMDDNRRAFNHGINEAIDAIDKEIVAHKGDKK